MRKLLVGFIVLCATLAFGQQWQVVKSVNLIQQSQAIPLTTLLTPSAPGSYRIGFYFSEGGGQSATAPAFYEATLTGQDITGLPDVIDTPLSCKVPVWESASQIISLKAGVPLTYVVNASGTPGQCTYNLTITVEQLL